jgi:thiol-disulfide isomerase/thioredoxin
MRWEFELLALDREQPANRKLLEEIGVAKAAEGPPRLAVLSSEGALTAIYPLVLEGQKLSSRPLAEFLFQHKLPTRDASQMLAAGLKQAQAEDNRVIFSASWCAPCRLLAAFLAEHKAELERHFVFVKLDVSRDERAEELREQYKESKSGGVPWYTILDAQGRMLVTSNAPGQERFGGNNNIGFPGEPAGIEHFVGMLRQTAPRLSAEKLDEIRTALLKPKP